MNQPKVPSGIAMPDLQPEPKGVRRVSKRIAVLGTVVLLGFLGVVIYGQVRISQRKVERETEAEEKKTWKAASSEETAKNIQTGAAPLLSGKPTTAAQTKVEISSAPPVINMSALPPQLPYRQATLREFPRVEPPPMQNPIQSFQPASEEDRLQAAIRAPLTPIKQQGVAAAGGPSIGNSYIAPTIASQATAATIPANPKLAFLAAAQQHKTATDQYLPATRTPQLGLYEIKAGWEIPGVLEQELNSDLPGEIKGLVTQNVYDTATGRYLLIPQGCRLIGKYDSSVDYGQEGVQVVWDRIIFPDGSSITLDGMIGHDSQGRSGMREKVDRHYKRTIAMGLMSTLFVLPFDLVQRKQYNYNGYPSPAETAAASVSREMSQTGNMITRRNLNVQPTVKVAAGYRFTVRVSKDIYFAEPYAPYDNTPAAPEPSGTFRRTAR